MTAYAVAHLHTPNINDDVLEYMDKVQDTLDPYQGRFLVHGVQPDVKEGPFPGTIVIVEFPDLESANAWYSSPAYQAILRLRTDNIDGTAIIVDGVPDNYDARRTAAKFRELMG